MMREFALDNTSPEVDPYDYENDPLCNLLSCVGLKCLIDQFHNHGVFSLEDFLERTREEFLSYGFINDYDYDNLVEIFNKANSFLNNNDQVTIDTYRESIMGYESTRRLRESISRHSKPDVAELDDYHRDSLLDKLSGIKSHDFEEAMNWKVPKLKGYRNTVNVVSTPYREVHAYPPSIPIPRRSENVVHQHYTKPPLEPLPSINENSFCDGLTEISGGVYTDNDLSEGSVEVYLASNGLPQKIERTANSISVPINSRFDNRQAIPTAFSVDGVFDDNKTANLVKMITDRLQPKVDQLFRGQSFTCCFYGSLLSPAAALFYDNKTNQEDFYEDSFHLEDPIDLASNSSVLQQLGEMTLTSALEKDWRVGMSAFLIQENAVFDLLRNKARLAVSDSGTILFMKNITCYEVQNRMDIHSVISTIKYTETVQPLTGHIVVIFQLLNPQNEYVSRMAVSLLAPCDKIVPMEEKLLRGNTFRYKTNGDVTSALMTLSRVLTPCIRQPFRDNKLTLYLRPFIYRTSFVLIGCLPPPEDSIASIPTVYLKKSVLKPHKITGGNKPLSNSENFISIIRYCNAIYKSNHKTGTSSYPAPRRTMITRGHVPSNGGTGAQNAFIVTTTHLDNEITNLRKAVNEYLTLYSRDISTSRRNQTVSTMLRKASELSNLLSRLSKA